MSQYKCKYCNYITKRKHDFNKHLKTNKHKTNKDNYGVICLKTVDSNNHSLKKPQLDLNIPQYPSKNEISRESNFDIKEEKKVFRCTYCDKVYSRLDNLNRHILKSCKKKKDMDEKETMELKQIIQDQSKQISKIEKLLENSGNLTQNTQNNNNTYNTINNTININNYGEENLEMLTDDFKRQCVIKPYYALTKIIEKIHFNDAYPENKNIRLVNKRDNKIQVLNDGKWNYRDKEVK
tara:strand:- start:34 stop:744 length:711 start_codon:yes stop_codon:yes gene_type:complete